VTPVREAFRGIQATTIAVGSGGILIRGASGSGKSSLAVALIERVRSRHFARLVADDVTRIEARGGRVIARTVPATSGLVERRGLGIVPCAATPAVVVRLVVDCAGAAPERLPEPEMLITTLLGIVLPRIQVEGSPRDVSLVLSALDVLSHEGFE
jgi:serine kinase of HPr protein (carbohydrate metabolism regulator)